MPSRAAACARRCSRCTARSAQGVLESSRETDPARAVGKWLERHGAAAGHARAVINDIRAQTTAIDFASLSVALQAVRRVAAVAD